jgi:hypothetical protein
MATKNQQLESVPPRNELQENEFSSEKLVTFENKGTQCYFFDEARENYKLFVCNCMRDGNLNEAETQTYIPPSKEKIIVEAQIKPISKDKCCGEEKVFVDTAVGPCRDIRAKNENTLRLWQWFSRF